MIHHDPAQLPLYQAGRDLGPRIGLDAILAEAARQDGHAAELLAIIVLALRRLSWSLLP
jgi:hypothetical protein